MKMSNSVKLSLFVVCSFFSCKKEYYTQSQPDKSLLSILPLAAGAECANGGLIIKSGIDKNNNNILESTEVESTQYICNGTNGNYDKQIIIPLKSESLYSNSTEGDVIFSSFDIQNYEGIDSVVLYSKVGNTGDGSDVTATGTVLLYNYTDNAVIESSEATSLPLITYGTISNSGNCFNNFPKKAITLGIKVISSNANLAYAFNTYMVLYRK